MDIPSHNLDNVFKESLSLFKDKTLDFLGLTGIAPITEHLGAEERVSYCGVCKKSDKHNHD